MSVWRQKKVIYFIVWKIWKIALHFIAFSCFPYSIVRMKSTKCVLINWIPFNTLSASNYYDLVCFHHICSRKKMKKRVRRKTIKIYCMICFPLHEKLFSFYLVSTHKLESSLNYISQLLLQFIFHVLCLFFFWGNIFAFVFMTTFDNSCFRTEKRRKTKNNIKFISSREKIIFFLCLCCKFLLTLYFFLQDKVCCF